MSIRSIAERLVPPASKRLAPFFENGAEAGAACLVTMAQGNVLALGMSHWLVASQTGLIAGAAVVTVVAVVRTDNRLVLAMLLGIVTAVVDYFVHPGMIGTSALTEAVVTGLGAAILSYAVGTILGNLRRRPAAADIDRPVNRSA